MRGTEPNIKDFFVCLMIQHLILSLALSLSRSLALSLSRSLALSLSLFLYVQRQSDLRL
jgi:hypothetical protein